MPTPPRYDRSLVFTAACLGMLVFGVVVTTLGALLPSLIAEFGIDRSNAGSLLLLMSVGILAGSVVFGPVADRYGHRGLLLIGLALVLAGLEGIAFAPSLATLRVAILLVGFGGGMINGGTNALVADISQEGRTAGLSLLGIFFGLGAVGVPFALGMLLDVFSYVTVMAGVGLTVLLPLGLVLVLVFPGAKQAHGFPLARGARLLRERPLLLLGTLLFLQSGMEITVGGWTASYYQERMGLDGPRALFFLSLFWLGMMLARLLLGTLFRATPGARVLPLSIAVALAGSALMMTATRLPLAGAGTFLVGAGLAAGFPVVLGRVGERYAALSGTAFGIVLVMALTGGSLLPWVTGVLGEGYGLRASLLVVPAALMLQLALFALALRDSPAPAPAPTPAEPEPRVAHTP